MALLRSALERTKKGLQSGVSNSKYMQARGVGLDDGCGFHCCMPAGLRRSQWGILVGIWAGIWAGVVRLHQLLAMPMKP